MSAAHARDRYARVSGEVVSTPSDQLSILMLVATRLDSAAIPYMITGSIGASHYARPRMTRDIDLVVELQPRDAERLVTLFADQFECDVDAIRSAIERQSLFNLIHDETIVKVDFIVRKNSAYRLDWPYIDRWAESIGVMDLLREVRG